MRQLSAPKLGVGLGWRPELAWYIERRPQLGFVEIVAENLAGRRMPRALERLRARGTAIIPHGIGLSLGGEGPVDPARVSMLARLAERVGAPLVSEHVCFVRAGGMESGHLLPVARTRRMLDALVANVHAAQRVLPVPLALENIATLFEWPGDEMTEAQLLAELVERTGCRLLLDVANLWANARNLGWDVNAYLDEVPLRSVAYVHVAGGVSRGGMWHDTHAHAIGEGAIRVLAEVAARTEIAGVMIERDDHFPGDEVMDRELERVRRTGNRQQATGDRQPASSCRRLASEVVVGEQRASQAEVLGALLGRSEVPAGFDEVRVRAAGAARAAKRARAVAKAVPEMVRGLADGFGRAFDEYARAEALAESPEADALGFARWCAGRGRLAEAAMREWLGMELCGRRWRALRAGRRRVLAVRAPWVGVRWIEIAA